MFAHSALLCRATMEQRCTSMPVKKSWQSIQFQYWQSSSVITHKEIIIFLSFLPFFDPTLAPRTSKFHEQLAKYRQDQEGDESTRMH